MSRIKYDIPTTLINNVRLLGIEHIDIEYQYKTEEKYDGSQEYERTGEVTLRLECSPDTLKTFCINHLIARNYTVIEND